MLFFALSIAPACVSSRGQCSRLAASSGSLKWGGRPETAPRPPPSHSDRSRRTHHDGLIHCTVCGCKPNTSSAVVRVRQRIERPTHHERVPIAHYKLHIAPFVFASGLAPAPVLDIARSAHPAYTVQRTRAPWDCLCCLYLAVCILEPLSARPALLRSPSVRQLLARPVTQLVNTRETDSRWPRQRPAGTADRARRSTTTSERLEGEPLVPRAACDGATHRPRPAAALLFSNCSDNFRLTPVNPYA